MKLYTEEQVLKMLEVCRDSDLYEHILTFQDILKTETSIELPSDEEIDRELESHEHTTLELEAGFRAGARWMVNKIQGGNK